MKGTFSGILDLARDALDPLHVQITEQIKAAIVTGKLPANMRIPSSRILSSELGVSRNTVLAAIEQLKSEGLLETIRGSGARVTGLLRMDFERGDPAETSAKIVHRLAGRWQEPLEMFSTAMLNDPKPFQPGLPDLDAFPKELWATCLRRAARTADDVSSGYGEMSGHPRFRKILARHLAETRSVIAEPEQIIVTSSARGGLSLIASALLSPGEEAWVEEPGFRSAKAIFAAAGGRVIPVPVDAQGIDPSSAPHASKPRLIYTTPSHQFPTGVMMSLSRRLALIEAATRSGGYIVEDDYNSEFQYRGRPIAALQGLDNAECVLYLGSFAKSLVPGLRVGFVVVPPDLAEGFSKIHRQIGQLVPPIMQLALADFIERGHYRAHIRRMKTVYARRLAQFTEGIAKYSQGRLEAAVPDGGLQTVVTSQEGQEDQALAKYLAKADIQSQPLDEFYITRRKGSQYGVLMGFAAWGEREVAQAFARLSKIYG